MSVSGRPPMPPLWLQAGLTGLIPDLQLTPWQWEIVRRIEDEFIYGERSGVPVGLMTTGQLAFDQARARERAVVTRATLLTVQRWRCRGGEWVPR